MLKNPAKIEALFRDTLLSDEEIYWLGAPLHNFWHFSWRQLYTILLLIPRPVFWLLNLWVWIQALVTKNLLLSLLFILILLLDGILRQIRRESEQNRQSEIPIAKGAWWKPSYYAITNMRVLIFEQGNIRDYWYHLLDTPILKKPKNRATSIQLYSSTYAAKKKKTPVLDTLRGIPENEADDAFAILKQAREEALEERKDKMGRG